MNKAWLLVALLANGCALKQKQAESEQQYAQWLITGEVKPSDDPKTLAWLDSLHSTNPQTRQLAFKVYQVLASQGDGALGEAISESTYQYFSTRLPEFWQNYLMVSDKAREQLKWDLAAGLYGNGIESPAVWETYLSKMEAENGLQVNEDFKTSVELHLRRIANE